MDTVKKEVLFYFSWLKFCKRFFPLSARSLFWCFNLLKLSLSFGERQRNLALSAVSGERDGTVREKDFSHVYVYPQKITKSILPMEII